MNGLGLALRLARRELRAGVRGFRVFILSLALGVAAIAGVGSLGASVQAGLAADARALLGGDVDVRLSHRPATPEQIARLGRDGRLSRVVEMRAMARPEGDRGRRSLVQLKAVDGAYPLVGTVRVEPAQALGEALARRGDRPGAVADANLLARLGIGLGDLIRVGEAVFEVRGTIAAEPDRVASVANFGPRLMIAEEALAETDLVRPGAQVQYHYRVVLGPGTDAGRWRAALTAAFPEAGWQVRDTGEAAPGVDRFVERLTLFLTVDGLTALLVGGVGVANGVGGYMARKTAVIATFKCLGAPGRLVFATYLAQVLALAALGVALGLAVGALLPAAALPLLDGRLPVKAAGGLYVRPLAEAALFGFLTALTFALLPLARARRVAAGGLFRHVVAPPAGPVRRPEILAAGLGAAALAGLTFAVSADRGFAAWFVGGAAATLLALRLAAALAMALARRAPRAGGGALRLALANLHRPGAATPAVVLSLGLGLSVLVAVALIEGNMSRELAERIPRAAPAFFFIDIQPDQAAAFDKAVTAVPGAGEFRRVPSLRGRIVAIDGVPVERAAIAPEAAWAVRGDRALTYAARSMDGTRLVAGEWWPADYAGPPLVSLDAGVARGFGLGVGGSLTVNVLGRDVTARVASLREIDWHSLRFDFAIVFAPGALEEAPQTHIAAVHVRPGAEEAVERAATDRFPNVTSIRVREAIEAADAILKGIAAAVRAVAALALLAGALVLAGAVAAGRQRRLYDAVVFKVLGATRATVLKVFLAEYGLLGLATGAVAAGVGTLTAWAVVVFLMDAPWTFLPGVAAATLLACLALTLLFGFAGTWRALGQKAAPLLRNE